MWRRQRRGQLRKRSTLSRPQLRGAGASARPFARQATIQQAQEGGAPADAIGQKSKMIGTRLRRKWTVRHEFWCACGHFVNYSAGTNARRVLLEHPVYSCGPIARCSCNIRAERQDALNLDFASSIICELANHTTKPEDAAYRTRTDAHSPAGIRHGNKEGGFAVACCTYCGSPYGWSRGPCTVLWRTETNKESVYLLGPSLVQFCV